MVSRRDLLKTAPLIAVAAVANEHSSNTSLPQGQAPPEHLITDVTQNIRELLDQRKTLKSSIFKRLTQSIIKLCSIDQEDFYRFAEGRVDRMGNFVAMEQLNSSARLINGLVDSRMPGFEEAKNRLDEIQHQIDGEKKMLEVIDPFLSSYRATVKEMQSYLEGKSSDERLFGAATLLKSNYHELVQNYGSLCETLRFHSLELVIQNDPLRVRHYDMVATKATTAGRLPERPTLCCRTNMTCETDTLDCGFFDNCSYDACGVGDGGGCSFYDDAGCACNIEDT